LEPPPPQAAAIKARTTPTAGATTRFFILGQVE
jgi:hypothetical protein